VAADRHQAAADECRIGRRIERREFADGIDQEDLTGSIRHDAGAPAHEVHPALRQPIGHRIEARRMPRDQHEQRTARQFLMRGQHRLLFTRMRAARDPDGSRRPKGLAQLPPACGDSRTQFQVELDVADHVSPGTLCADGNEAVGILASLRRYHRTGGEDSAQPGSEAPVARR